ncbi:tetratricopeptide repeat protein [Ursidibacter arcticus]
MKIKGLRIKRFKCSGSAWQCFKKYWKRIILGLVIFSGIGTAIGVYLYLNSESYYRSELSFTELYEKAKSGNAKAQYILSRKYGYGDNKDEYKEMYWLESAANNGYAEAAENLGYHYYRKDKEKSLLWYEKAYAQGADVALWLARLYADKGEYQQAIKFYKKTDSYYSYPELAELYDEKLQDGVEAEKWYLKQIDETDDSFNKSRLIFELIERYQYDYYNMPDRKSNVKNNLQKIRQLYHQLGGLLDQDMNFNVEQYLAETYLTGKEQYSKDYIHVVVEKNVAKGIKILERLAAYKGESAYILGEIYETGEFRYENLDMKIDLEKAKYYYKVACDRYYDCTAYQRLNSNGTNTTN